MSDIRIFVSYDIENDADLCDRLLDQSNHGGSGFEIAGVSEKASDPEGERVRRRIDAADEVIVLCGEHTDESPRASSELKIAQEEEKPYLLLWGRREVMCKRPVSAKPGDVMYSWTEEILRDQIAATLRNAGPREVPENCKRAVPRAAAASGD